jgi:hypothetical protein
MEPVPVARELRDKRRMKALILWWDEAQWPLAREALIDAGRRDLIGLKPSCLIPPEHASREPGRFGGARGAKRGGGHGGNRERSRDRR